MKNLLLLLLLFIVASSCGTNTEKREPRLEITDSVIVIENQDGYILENKILKAVKGQGTMIKIIDSSNVIVRNNVLSGLKHKNAHGLIIKCKKACKNIVVENNTFTDMYTGNSEVLTLLGDIDGFRIEGNYLDNISNIGIDLISDEGSWKGTVRNGVVKNNIVKNVTRTDYWTGHYYCDGCQNVLFEGNLAENKLGNKSHATGIEIGAENDVPAKNITIRNNTMKNFIKPCIYIGNHANSTKYPDTIKIENNKFENCEREIVWKDKSKFD